MSRIVARGDLQHIAEHELERDWTLRCYMHSRSCRTAVVASVLADDIRVYGEMARIMQTL